MSSPNELPKLIKMLKCDNRGGWLQDNQTMPYNNNRDVCKLWKKMHHRLCGTEPLVAMCHKTPKKNKFNETF